MVDSSISQSLKVLLHHFIAIWSRWKVVLRWTTFSQPNKVVRVSVMYNAISLPCMSPQTFDSVCLPNERLLCKQHACIILYTYENCITIIFVCPAVSANDWMSKITNDGLTRSGAGCFTAASIGQQWASKG